MGSSEEDADPLAAGQLVVPASLPDRMLQVWQYLSAVYGSDLTVFIPLDGCFDRVDYLEPTEIRVPSV